MTPDDDSTLPLAAAGSAPPLGGRCGRYVVEGPLGAGGMGIVVAAHDPTLGRRVALKLLHAETGRARIELEAQAMARLSHPNVVTVFEVDRVDGRTFVAMELIEGSTLRRWLAAAPRSWREIVEMFVTAGRGLAAAHAAGLVHRDFKPDNVLIGSDGRPRVSDFGLVYDAAGTLDNVATDRSIAPSIAVDTTLRGSAVGTPAYMSPEQWRGGPVDARGDQFAFCVALWEALWGDRPFPGATPVVLRAAVQAGAISAPSGGRRIPRRIERALRRGLSVDPGARWPDMPALLAVLARATQVRRRWVVAAIATTAAVASAATAAWIVGARDVADPCAVPTERLAAVWTPVRRATLAAALVGADPASGADRAARIGTTFDGAASGWSAMYVDACRATHEGRQSDTLLDRRMACLDRWLAELGDTVRVVEQARDPVAVDHALVAATGLSPLAACADLAALSEALPPPSGVAQRTAAESLARSARAADVEQRAGRLDGLPARMADLVASARGLGYPPTLAEVLTVAARVDFAIGDETAAEAIMRELSQVAASAHDDADAAFAWTNLILTLGRNQGKVDAALALVPTANAAVLRAGDPAALRADLLHAQATIMDNGPHPEQGLALLTEARRVLEAAGATAPGSPLAARLADIVFEIGTAHAMASDNDAAIASFHQAIDRWRALYGVDSPDEAYAWQNIGATRQRAGKLDEALAAFSSALRIRQARLGDSPMTASSHVAVATVLNAQTRWDEALAHYDRAIQIDRAHLAPDDLQLQRSLVARATTLAHLHRLDEAARAFDEAIAAYERSGAKTVDVASAFYNRGKLAGRRGRCDAALADHARAIALIDEVRGPSSEALVFPLVGEGTCLIQLGRPRDAIAPLERAIALGDKATNTYQRAVARAYLGRIRIELGSDVAGGRAMIEAAHATIAADSDGADVLRELDAWLARRVP